MTERRCLDDRRGKPFCGAPAEGALLVDEPIDTTCSACLVAFSLRVVPLSAARKPNATAMQREGAEMIATELRKLAGAPVTGWPKIDLPGTAAVVTLDRDGEVSSQALAAFLSAGGELHMCGFRLVTTGEITVKESQSIQNGRIFTTKPSEE